MVPRVTALSDRRLQYFCYCGQRWQSCLWLCVLNMETVASLVAYGASTRSPLQGSETTPVLHTISQLGSLAKSWSSQWLLRLNIDQWCLKPLTMCKIVLSNRIMLLSLFGCAGLVVSSQPKIREVTLAKWQEEELWTHSLSLLRTFWAVGSNKCVLSKAARFPILSIGIYSTHQRP